MVKANPEPRSRSVHGLAALATITGPLLWWKRDVVLSHFDDFLDNPFLTSRRLQVSRTRHRGA